MKKVCSLPTRDVVDRIIKFCELVANAKFYAYQSVFVRRVIESVLLNDGANITGLWSRQSGKSLAVSAVCAGLAVMLPALYDAFPDDPRFMPFARGFSVGIFAPIEEQALIPYGRIREMLGSDHGLEVLSDPELDIRLVASRGDKLALSNGGVITSKTASPQSKIEGGTYNLIILEESQLILRSKVEKEILPMASSTRGTLVHIGTAWESRGGFHNQIQINEEIHAATGVRNHFGFDFQIVCDEKRRAYEKDGNPWHLNYEKSIQDQMARFNGEESIEFKMNYRCLWREAASGAVIKSIFTTLSDPRIDAMPRREGIQIAGLDVGKTNDPSVLTVITVDMNNPVVCENAMLDSGSGRVVRYPKTITDWMEMRGSFEGGDGQYQKLMDRLSYSNVKILVVDTTALGDPVFERIQVMVGDRIMCVPFKFSSMSKSHIYKYFLQELHARRITYAGGPNTITSQEYLKFCSQMLSLDKFERGGYTICAAQEGAHDDYPDSAALACWGEHLQDQMTMPFIEVSSTPLFDKVGGRASGRVRDSELSGMPEITSSGGARSRYTRRWA